MLTIFVEHLVVFGDGDEEEEHVYAFEAVNPVVAVLAWPARS